VGTNTAQEVKAKRIREGIPARLLAPRAKLSCARLSDIERGYVEPSLDELGRIAAALDELIAARNKVLAYAEKVGWPVESI